MTLRQNFTVSGWSKRTNKQMASIHESMCNTVSLVSFPQSSFHTGSGQRGGPGNVAIVLHSRNLQVVCVMLY